LNENEGATKHSAIFKSGSSYKNFQMVFQRMVLENDTAKIPTSRYVNYEE